MRTATVTFSVPEEVKTSFNETFAGKNKSAVIATLMQEAVEERRRQQRRTAAIDGLLELRSRQRPVSSAELTAARRDADITRRLNEFFATEPGLVQELTQAAYELNAAGTDWTDEGW